MKYSMLVEVRLREGIADPQGATVGRAMPALGFTEVSNVGIGKAIRLDIEAPDESSARRRVEELCEKFLTNPVIESADISVVEGATASV